MHKRLLGPALIALLAVAVGTPAAEGRQASARDTTPAATAGVGPFAFLGQAVLRHASMGDAQASTPRYMQSTGDRRPSERRLSSDYAKLPLSFVPNAGQIDARVRYSAQAGKASFYFTAHEAVFAFATRAHGLALRLCFAGANPKPAVTGFGPRSGKVNYLIGNDRARWHTNVPTYGGI